MKKRIREWLQPLEHLFVIAYLLVGLLAVFAVPIHAVMDDPLHYLRAYEISMGKLVPIAKEMPDGEVFVGDYLHQGAFYFESDTHASSLEGELGRMFPYFGFHADPFQLKWNDYPGNWQREIDCQSEEFYLFQTTAMYAPTNYLPHVIGIVVARAFTQKSMLVAYTARFMNWLLVGLVLFQALKIMPESYKLLAMAVALIPMNQQQINSLSPDGMMFAVALLMLSLIMAARQSGRLSRRRLALLAVLAIYLSLTKIVYVPLAALLLLLPGSAFAGAGSRYKYLAAVFAGAAAANLLWLHTAMGFLSAQSVAWASPEAQKAFMLAHPLHFLKVLLDTYLIDGKNFLWMAMGAQMGWEHLQISKTLLAGYGLALFLAWLRTAQRGFDWTRWERLGVAVMVLLIIVLASAAVYVSWTPLQQGHIDGLRGKYFLVLFLPALLAVLPARDFIWLQELLPARGIWLLLLLFDILVFGQMAQLVFQE